jgi:hypothetical protein
LNLFSPQWLIQNHYSNSWPGRWQVNDELMNLMKAGRSFSPCYRANMLSCFHVMPLYGCRSLTSGRGILLHVGAVSLISIDYDIILVHEKNWKYVLYTSIVILSLASSSTTTYNSAVYYFLVELARCCRQCLSQCILIIARKHFLHARSIKIKKIKRNPFLLLFIYLYIYCSIKYVPSWSKNGQALTYIKFFIKYIFL